MQPIYYPLLTAAFTASLGAVVFVVGQIFLKLIVEPVQEQYRTKGQVTHALTFYRNVYEVIDPGQMPEARRVHRDLAAGLLIGVDVIPLYRVLAALRLVIPKEKVRKASTALIGLSNSIGNEDELDDAELRRQEIAESLGIKYP